MARLKFGTFLAPHHPLGEHPTLQFQRDLDFAAHLDRLGLDEFWCGEHHSSGWEMIASPEMFLAAAGQRTQRIMLGTGVVCIFLGIRGLRRQKRGEPVVPVNQRHKRFTILFVSLVAGFVGGYFLIRHDHPEFSVAFSLAICALGLIFATGLIAWQIYRPRATKT